jgi:hypothetical protein
MTFKIDATKIKAIRIAAPAAAGFLLLATGSAFAHGGGGGGNHGGNDIHMSSSMTAMKSGGMSMSQNHVIRDHGNSGNMKVGKSDNSGLSRKHNDHSNKTSDAKTTGSLKRADDTKATASKTATTAAANTSSSAMTTAASTSGTKSGATAPVAANPATSVALAMASAPLPGTGGTNTIHPIIAPAPLPGTGGTNTIHPIIASPPATSTSTLVAGPSLGQIGKAAVGGVLVLPAAVGVASAIVIDGAVAGAYGLFKGGLPEAYGNVKSVATKLLSASTDFFGSLF